MPSLEYSSLTKTQKTAAFLVLIGAEAAANILKHFNDSETESIIREMANLPIVDFEVQEALMEEFTGLIGSGVTSALGGISYARQTLEMARGQTFATSILNRAIPPADTNDAVRKLTLMEPRQIVNLLKVEQPQTIAFVLSYLDTDKAAEIVPLLPEDRRDEVVQRLADMDPTSMELVGKVLMNLNKHIDDSQQQELQRRGGVEVAAQLLNRLDAAVSKTILSKVDERNSTLSAAIRRKMFVFDDFVRLTPPDLQRVLRNIETRDVAISLKSARESLKRAVFSGMSRRASEALREEMDMLGPVRMKEVEAARDKMILAARALEDAGEISLVQEASDAVVS